ncbi:CHAT domain-containing tetratricopeptide repeat protein [uncultured Dokdonia sp.]|mgnify:CR=1 FL=1|uniref:CHAT domain-containing protein n=1 Tax=uncultured Dokdonia sp. TaxID=575653 RepID=UPI0026303BFC|nr:CHAT domain-containing tetratricopeptide repeat protein [uncultured Dokdonia sp.]
MKSANTYMRFFLLSIGIFLFWNTTIAQQSLTSVVDSLGNYLTEGKTTEAGRLLAKEIDRYKSTPDSLYALPYYVGKIARIKNSAVVALHKMEDFLKQLEVAGASEKTRYLAKLSMAEFYDEIGASEKALKITEEALTHVLKSQEVTQEEIGKVKYNLGASYLTAGDMPKASTWFREALKDYTGYAQTNKKKLSDGYNAMGAIMWMSSKLDSAAFYYDNASKIIKEAPGDSIENLYYATVIKSNVSLLEHSQGHIHNALEIQEEVIRNYEKVIRGIKDPELKGRAQRYQARAISNLATFYNELGNLTRANQLMQYSYKKKKEFLEPLDTDLGTTLIRIGQSEISLRAFDKALQNIQQGLAILQQKETLSPYWEATAYNGLASIYNELGKYDSTTYFYKKATPLFEQALGENIDAEYLSYLGNKSLFESEQGNYEEALKTAQKSYTYVLDNSGAESLNVTIQMLNLSKIYITSEDYAQARYWSEKADALLQQKMRFASSGLDSIKLDFNRPLLLLLKTKARYKSQAQPTEGVLLELVKDLAEGIAILERRMVIALTPADVDQLLSEYRQVNDFLKRLYLDLYQKTQKTTYLIALMTLHESGIYNRIRAKLNYQNVVAISGVPEEVLLEEKNRKEALLEMFSGAEMTESLSYFEKEKQWHIFQDTLKKRYPKYYKMRYETIQIEADEVIQSVPETTSVVRYFFIEKELYAFVITHGKQYLMSLDFNDLEGIISQVVDQQFDEAMLLGRLHTLYNRLWKPIADLGLTKDVIIIPDGSLYNLSFEMLTPTKVVNYEDLVTASLLNDHDITYNFSLLMIQPTSSRSLQNNFIAFTPEFTKGMKDDYKVAIVDSLDIDQTYLTLLSQPFSVDVAQNYNRLFDGDHFKNKAATKQLFIENAGEHKIIHIGTHAESNNIRPELSRLIFAKRITDNQLMEDNSLYTYEIYNCNLTANLAILTACETGKPTYQAGEGMISLAHAFTYAGSESILTSLWKIDEQSSSLIVGYFYDNLEEGMPKHVALKKAKQQYLQTVEGRLLQPNYWAGLVLMGDNTPIDISQDTVGNTFWYSMLAIVVIVAMFFLLRSKKKKDSV